MGYYTKHELEVQQGSNDLIEELRESCEGANYAIKSNGDPRVKCKWHDHSKDMKVFSALHPHALFKLSGEGEDAEDLWREYHKNGKVQVCKAVIAYPQFNSYSLV